MSAWQVVLMCWLAYMLGFGTAALMAAARDTDPDPEDYKAGLNDD